MSVKTYKKIITIVILIAIFVLAALAFFFGNRYFQYKEKLESPTLIDAAEYGFSNAEECKNALLYISSVASKASFEYQNAYPDMFVENDFSFADTSGKKICYLTFDDGPYKTVTPEVLDVLKKYDVKATFFVIYKNAEPELSLYKRIAAEGHTLAVHTASHDYNKIYASVEAYLDDFAKVSEHVEKLTGVKPELFRFPGGSVNSFNASVRREIAAEMIRRGYLYYDWNVSGGDAERAGVPSGEITRNVLNATASGEKKIVLLHDGPGHEATARALPDIIEGLKAQGYTFAPLDNSVAPIIFG